jgi:hypothetical protein
MELAVTVYYAFMKAQIYLGFPFSKGIVTATGGRRRFPERAARLEFA